MHPHADSANVLWYLVIPQLLDMVERNELNMSILTLLDENIASAKSSNQVMCCPLASSLHQEHRIDLAKYLGFESFDNLLFVCDASNLYTCLYCSGRSRGFHGGCALSNVEIHNSINSVLHVRMTSDLRHRTWAHSCSN